MHAVITSRYGGSFEAIVEGMRYYPTSQVVYSIGVVPRDDICVNGACTGEVGLLEGAGGSYPGALSLSQLTQLFNGTGVLTAGSGTVPKLQCVGYGQAPINALAELGLSQCSLSPDAVNYEIYVLVKYAEPFASLSYGLVSSSLRLPALLTSVSAKWVTGVTNSCLRPCGSPDLENFASMGGELFLCL